MYAAKICYGEEKKVKNCLQLQFLLVDIFVSNEMVIIQLHQKEMFHCKVTSFMISNKDQYF